MLTHPATFGRRAKLRANLGQFDNDDNDGSRYRLWVPCHTFLDFLLFGGTLRKRRTLSALLRRKTLMSRNPQRATPRSLSLALALARVRRMSILIRA